MDEKRKAPRHRTLKAGSIVFNHGGSVINCTVRNLSESGAKLVVVSVIGVPETFRLALSDGQSHECRIVWRTETELGVAFT